MSTVTEPDVELLDDTIEELDVKHRGSCAKGCLFGQDEVTGHAIIIPLCCKSWNCPACAIRLSERWADVAVRGQPDRFITLTGDPKLLPDPHEMRIAIKNSWAKFVAHWRRGRAKKGDKHRIPPHDLEYLAVWELHKSGYPHLHILVRGEYIPQSYLRQWMITAGVGEVVHICAVDNPRSAAAEVLKYVTKAAADVSGTLDGARIITTSRKYDPHHIYAVSNDNTPGYTWARLPVSPDVVLQYLIQNRGWSHAPRGSMSRMEIIPPADEHGYLALVVQIKKDLDLPG